MKRAITHFLASIFLCLPATTLIPTSVQAQGFYPLHLGNLWEYWERLPRVYAGQARVVGDTLMPNGQTYRNIVSVDQGGSIEFLRQVGPVVYRYLPYPPTPEEVIAYDFSRTTGDTVTIRYYPHDTVIVIVARDGYALVFGRWLRQWEFHERSLHFWITSIYEVTDSIGLTRFQGEPPMPTYLEGAIINGIQYGTITRVTPIDSLIPKQFRLQQNYSNPFNPTTNFKFKIANVSYVSLKVYDVLGREVATLVSEELQPGSYEVTWDASQFPSGAYFSILRAGRFLDVKKIMLLK